MLGLDALQDAEILDERGLGVCRGRFAWDMVRVWFGGGLRGYGDVPEMLGQERLTSM